jgi:hypothetical protein
MSELGGLRAAKNRRLPRNDITSELLAAPNQEASLQPVRQSKKKRTTEISTMSELLAARHTPASLARAGTWILCPRLRCSSRSACTAARGAGCSAGTGSLGACSRRARVERVLCDNQANSPAPETEVRLYQLGAR